MPLINGFNIVKGGHYTKDQLGIEYPQILKGKIVKEKEDLLFITINNKDKYQNELHHDGIVHQADEKLMDYVINNNKIEKTMYIFIRYFDDDPFLYIGELEYVIRYDIKRNKLIIKGNHNVDNECVIAKKL